MLEACLNALIEVFAMLDFVLDYYILFSLAHTVHIWWFSLSLIFMICPYYTVYTSMMNFQIKALQRKEHNLVITFFTIIPTMLVILVVIDICYMIATTIILPILIILAFVT